MSIGGKGASNHRWSVDAKAAYVISQHGLIVAWDYPAPNAPDNVFHELIAEFHDDMAVCTDI